MSLRRASDDGQQTDAALEQVLKDFRSSVHAWSEAEYGEPHRLVAIHTTSWRMVAGWALGCVLAVGSVSGALYERHHVKEEARIAAAAEAARQRSVAAEQPIESEDLFAKVESDVSREVPSAMEPLAQMMAEDSAQ